MELIEKWDRQKWYQIALGLAIFTIVYNLAEGLLSSYFGWSDESFALFGFGMDSFIEVISGMGIVHMIVRSHGKGEAQRDDFERTALRITGIAFYLLVIFLVITSLHNMIYRLNPVTTVAGIIISLVSILSMWLLILAKQKAGNALNSPAILADANCTKVCLYMSFILLLSSGLYHWFSIPYVDSLGALGLAWFSYKEGKECFEKASGKECCDCH